MIKSLTIAFAACALATLSSTPAEAGPTRSSVAGTYTANVEGTSVTLVLKADGTGSLAGEGGRWSLSGRTVELIDSEGSAVSGKVSGNTLTFSVEGSTIRFSKTSAPTRATVAKKTSKLRPFRPALVAGKTVRPKDANGSFRAPRGWSHRWGKGVDGQDAYNLTNKKQTVVVSLGGTMLTGNESSGGPAALIDAALSELLEGASVDRVIPTETFSVNGKSAGRVVVRAPVDGTPIEGYLLTAGSFPLSRSTRLTTTKKVVPRPTRSLRH